MALNVGHENGAKKTKPKLTTLFNEYVIDLVYEVRMDLRFLKMAPNVGHPKQTKIGSGVFN